MLGFINGMGPDVWAEVTCQGEMARDSSLLPLSGAVCTPSPISSYCTSPTHPSPTPTPNPVLLWGCMQFLARAAHYKLLTHPSPAPWCSSHSEMQTSPPVLFSHHEMPVLSLLNPLFLGIVLIAYILHPTIPPNLSLSFHKSLILFTSPQYSSLTVLRAFFRSIFSPHNLPIQPPSSIHFLF